MFSTNLADVITTALWSLHFSHVPVSFCAVSFCSLYIDGVLQKTSHAEDYYVKDIVRGLFLCHFPHWGKDYHHFNGYLGKSVDG